MGEASVKIAEAKKANAEREAEPGVELRGPRCRIDIDIAVAPEVEPMGYQYIKSMAKLIAAWIAS